MRQGSKPCTAARALEDADHSRPEPADCLPQYNQIVQLPGTNRKLRNAAVLPNLPEATKGASDDCKRTLLVSRMHCSLQPTDYTANATAPMTAATTVHCARRSDNPPCAELSVPVSSAAKAPEVAFASPEREPVNVDSRGVALADVSDVRVVANRWSVAVAMAARSLEYSDPPSARTDEMAGETPSTESGRPQLRVQEIASCSTVAPESVVVPSSVRVGPMQLAQFSSCVPTVSVQRHAVASASETAAEHACRRRAKATSARQRLLE